MCQVALIHRTSLFKQDEDPVLPALLIYCAAGTVSQCRDVQHQLFIQIHFCIGLFTLFSDLFHFLNKLFFIHLYSFLCVNVPHS